MIPAKLDIQLYRAASHTITIDVDNSVGAPFEIVGTNQLRIYRNYNQAAILTVPLTWNGTALVGTLDTDDSDIEAGSYPYHLWNVDGLAEKPVLRGQAVVADQFVGNFVDVVSSIVVDDVTYQVTVISGFISFDGFEFVEKFGSDAAALSAAWATKKRIQLQSRTKYELADNQLSCTDSADVVVEGNFAEIETETNAATLFINIPFDDEQVISAIDLTGDQPVLTIADATKYTYNDIVLIISEEEDPEVDNRFLAEVTNIYDIVDATNIKVHNLRNTYLITENVRIRKYSGDNIQIRNLYLSKDKSDPANYPGTDVNRTANLQILNAKNPIIERVFLKQLVGRGINILNCVGAIINDIVIEGGENNIAPGFFTDVNSNGIMNNSSFCIVKNVMFSGCRHGIHHGAVRPTDQSDYGLGGQAYGNLVVDCVGYNNTGTCYDTHPGSSHTTFNNCSSQHSQRGFMIRGVGQIIKKCESRNDNVGVEVLIAAAEFHTTNNWQIEMTIENSLEPVVYKNTKANGGIIKNTLIRNSKGMVSVASMFQILESYNLDIDSLIINIKNDWEFDGAIIKVANALSGVNVNINKMAINIASGVTLPAWSVIETNCDINFTINNLEINCPDAANYPQYLISSDALNVLTGKIYNSKFDGVAVKLHNQTLDNQTFVDNHGRGHIVIGDTILVKT